MTVIHRILSGSPPVRWARCLAFALRGVRVHPTCTVTGEVSIGYRCAVGRRTRLQAAAGAAIRAGERVWIADHVELECSGRVSIGPGTTIQRRCTINGTVSLGTRCILAPNIFVSSGSHPFRDTPWLPIREQEEARRRRGIPLPDAAVAIGDDCWIGTNAVICPGVRLGKGCVVGANAVVTRSVDPFTVVAGAPARAIGRRLAWTPPEDLDLTVPEALPYVVSDAPWPEGRPDVPGTVTQGFPFEAWITIGPGKAALTVHGTALARATLDVDGHAHAVDAGDFDIRVPVRAPGPQCNRVSIEVRDGGPVRIHLVRSA